MYLTQLNTEPQHTYLVHLALDRPEQHVQRLAGALLQELVQQERKPSAQHLLGHRFGAAQQQLRMRLAIDALLNQLGQQRLQNIGAVLQLRLQRHHDQRGDIHALTHRKVPIRLQRPDEQQQKRFVHDQLPEQTQPLLLAQQLGPLPLQHHVIFVVREQDLHRVRAIVEERNAARCQITGQVAHLRLQFGERLLAFGRHLQLQDVHLLLHVLQHAIRFARFLAVRDQQADEDQQQTADADDDAGQGVLAEAVHQIGCGEAELADLELEVRAHGDDDHRRSAQTEKDEQRERAGVSLLWKNPINIVQQAGRQRELLSHTTKILYHHSTEAHPNTHSFESVASIGGRHVSCALLSDVILHTPSPMRTVTSDSRHA